jgi:hypothetical protein
MSCYTNKGKLELATSYSLVFFILDYLLNFLLNK